MLVTIEDSSYDIFQATASDRDLSEDDWIRVGRAAVDLVGAATLITVPGTGPEDAGWVEDPRWRQLSVDMQTASMAVGAAANEHDRAALTESTARLAQSCQSCHLEFSSHLVTSPDEPALLRTVPESFP